MSVATVTRERGIIFSGPMVRAILDGRKTMTRRVVKLAVPEDAHEIFHWPSVRPMKHHKDVGLWARKHSTGNDGTDGWLRFLGPCPYGQPGDRLWVRETWAEIDDDHGIPLVVYRAGGHRLAAINAEGKPESFDGIVGKWADPKQWRSPIHMPRWASRLTLEITGVRVERVREISEADAIDEGAPCRTNPDYDEEDPADDEPEIHAAGFMRLWESIHGPDSWAANPWVWVVSFKRVDS